MSSEILKTPTNHRDLIKKETQERKRNLLYLMCNYLRTCNLHATADCLTEEAQLQENIAVCDNVDLDVILQEYQSYYMVKFQKMPKLTRKLDNFEVNATKTKTVRQKKPAITKATKNKKETIEEDEFQFEIINLNCNNQPNDSGDATKTKALCDFEAYNSEWRETAEQILKDVIPKNLGITWNDCVGLNDAINVIQETIIFPFIHPQLFCGTLTPFKGILLYGPPGTGKTLLAKALACQQTLPVFNVTCSSYVSKWRGESEKLLKTLFDVAKFYSPSIIFIDEVDAFVSTTSDHQHEASVRFKSELLVHMDGILNSDEKVFVFAITNSPWRLDCALLRRFEKRVLIGTPNLNARKEIFKYYFLKSGHKFTDKDLQTMAEVTENYSGAEIKIVCKEVMMNIVRGVLQENGGKKELRREQLKSPTVNDVVKATCKIKSSLNGGLLKKYSEWNEKYGCF